MSNVITYQRFWMRRDSAGAWTAANPVLAAGEWGVELGTPCRAKLGNGSTAWSDLPYFGEVQDGDKGDIVVSAEGETWTIEAGAITTAKLADGSVTTAKLANGSVTATKLDLATVEELIRDTVAAFLAPGTNVTMSHDDGANTFTINATASSSGGGGGSGGFRPFNFPEFLMTGATVYIGRQTSASLSYSTATTNRVHYMPFVVPESMTLTAMGTRINSGAAGKLRIGIYTDSVTGVRHQPGARIAQTGDLSTAATGLVSEAASIALTAGTIYWLAVATDASASILHVATASISAIGGYSSAATPAGQSGFFESLSVGWTSLPASATAPTALTNLLPAAYVTV